MKKPIQISIPAPCHENWDKMTPADKGRFCASCQKNVIDFTKASDREIATAFAKDKNMCGRFLDKQLNRDLIIPKEKSTVWIAAGVAALSFVGLGTQDSIAQVSPETEQHESEKLYVGEPAVTHPAKVSITGNISDDSGPLPYALIRVRNSTQHEETDFDGNFSMEVPEGAMLEVDFIGYSKQCIKVDNNKHYTIIMKEKELLTIGIIVEVERPTFFGRIFRRIGNLFR